MLAGIGCLLIFWMIGTLKNARQTPSWSLLAVGMLFSITVTFASGLFGGISALIFGGTTTGMVLMIILAAVWLLLVLKPWRNRKKSYTLTFVILIILCHLIIRLKYFLYYGFSWEIVGEWLTISLYAALIALLLPVAAGHALAKHHRQASLLFVLGAIYVGFQLLIDVNGKVSAQADNPVAVELYRSVIPLLLLIAGPLWFVRARDARGRLAGLLGLSGLAVVMNLIIVGLAYTELPIIIWLSFIPYTLSVLLTLVLAYSLYGPGTDLQEDQLETQAIFAQG